MALALSNLQSPIPNPQSAIPNPQSPIGNPQSPIGNPQSPIPNRQSAIDNGTWLSLEDAAVLLEAPPRTVRWRAAHLWAPRGWAELRPPASGVGRSTWWIHRAADSRLTRYPDDQARAERIRAVLLERFPEPHVDLAYRKAFWLRRWRDLCTGSSVPSSLRPSVPSSSSFILHPSSSPSFTERAAALAIVAEARATAGPEFPISVRSLQAWWSLYSALGPDGSIRGVEALVPRYCGSRSPLPNPQPSIVNPQPPTPNPQSSIVNPQFSRSPAAVAYFYAIYHSQAGHTVKTCHEATVREAQRQGWSWPETYSATTRWLRGHDQKDATCLHRDGPTAYSKKYLPHIERDWTALDPGHTYVCDHTQGDFWCTFESQQIRPWLTTIEDARSRCLVGWHLGDAPHQDAILSAMRMAFREWAVPQRLYIDQGKDFTSELLTGVTKRERMRYRKEFGPDWRNARRHQAEVFWFGVLGELGIEINYAIPYHPWSKGLMERFYGTFEDHCSKTFVTYCGNNTLNRPECLEQIQRGYTDAEKRSLKKKYGREWQRHAVLKLVDQTDIPTLDDARVAVGEWVELYHRSAHRGDGMDGRTPLAVWATAASLRKAGDQELLALLSARGVYRVGGNGVSFQLAGQRRTYGASSAALRRFAGREVFITLDPEHCEYCQAYTADPQSRVYIGRLEANERLPADCSIDELRQASQEVNRRRKAFNRAAAEAPARLRNAAREVAAHRRAQLAEARATGTDDLRAAPNLIPVRTGFEAVSIPVQGPFESTPDEYSHIHVDDINLVGSNGDDDADPNDPYAGIDANSIDFGVQCR